MRAPRDEAVDPAHRDTASRGPASLSASMNSVDVADALALAPDPRRGMRSELELDLEDVAGQAHAADRGPEQLGLVLVGEHSTMRPSATRMRRRAHVRAEASVA